MLKSMWRWLAIAALLGCASGGEDASTTSSADAAIDTRLDTAIADSFAPPGDAPIFPTEDTALPKICETPAGTLATASGSYMSAASDSVDHNLGTIWNSGGYTGWMKLTFPKPITFDRVRIAAMSLPDCKETYTISASSKIGGDTRALNGSTRWLDPIAVTPGTYSEITIDVAMAPSWITLAEVQVFDSTGGCKEP